MLFSLLFIKILLIQKYVMSIRDYLLLIYTCMCLSLFLMIIILSFQSHQIRIICGFGNGMESIRTVLEWKKHESMNGWLEEKRNLWMKEWMNEWMDGWMNGWMNEWLNGWINEWMEEWISVWRNLWMDEWRSQCGGGRVNVKY